MEDSRKNESTEQSNLKQSDQKSDETKAVQKDDDTLKTQESPADKGIYQCIRLSEKLSDAVSKVEIENLEFAG